MKSPTQKSTAGGEHIRGHTMCPQVKAPRPFNRFMSKWSLMTITEYVVLNGGGSVIQVDNCYLLCTL